MEDEPKLRESLAEGLQLEDWHVTTAASGAQALRRLETETFDLLILDWMLPDLDGIEILRRLRTRGMHVPALIISARASHADQITALKSGATDFVAKPFGFVDFLARCRALLAAD